jgi:hypothetical protein
MRNILPYFAIFAALWVVGCAKWQQTRSDRPILPPARMAPDSVAVEVAYVRQPIAETERDDSLWQNVDELSIPTELRRKHTDHGLRVGILGVQLPAAVRQLLDAGQEALKNRDESSVGENEFSYRHRRMHVRTGRRGKIIASKTFPTLTVLTREETSVRGHLFSQAQCLFGLRAFPQGDGRVRLELSPEIEHGETKNQWVGEEGTLVQKLNKEKLNLDALKIETLLSPGQTLLLGPTPDVKGLGEYFFTETSDSGKQRRYLLVRLAQTQMDDLFSSETMPQTLATPGD